MNWIAWLVLGFLAGAIAGMITGQRDSGCITRIVVGILGAFIGGGLARWAGYEGVTDFGIRSILVASLGALLLLLVLQALESGGRRRGRRLNRFDRR